MREIGFPPALVVVNPVDPLRDEGIALATGLVDSGCIAELHMFAGTFHGSLSVPDSVAWNEIRSLISRFMTENSGKNGDYPKDREGYNARMQLASHPSLYAP